MLLLYICAHSSNTWLVHTRQTYASLSTKSRPSPFLCIGWSIGQNLCPTLHENLLIMTPIYIIYTITSRPAIRQWPGKSWQRQRAKFIVQQLTTHNKHQFHDSQSSSHHTIQTLQRGLDRGPYTALLAGSRQLQQWLNSACWLAQPKPIRAHDRSGPVTNHSRIQ